MDYIRQQSRNDPETLWWEEAWRERELLFRDQFGETMPPNTVTAFYWDDIEIRIPGGCALTFSLNRGSRPVTLTLGHGLAQPLSRNDADLPDGRSAFGWEFAILTRDQPQWRFEALYQLMTYVRQSRRRIEPGHRVPFTFCGDAEGRTSVELGNVDLRPDSRPIEGAVAMVFWPLLGYPAELRTSTGKFGILVGTTISNSELALAKMTSSQHLLLLLLRCGIDQVSEIDRPSVLESERGAEEWATVKMLSAAEADLHLSRYAGNVKKPSVR